MNQNLIDTITTLTGMDEAAVQEKLSTLSVDDMYQLIALADKHDKNSIMKYMAPVSESARLPMKNFKSYLADVSGVSEEAVAEPTIVEEGIIGMTTMPPMLNRLLTLAGREPLEFDLPKENTVELQLEPSFDSGMGQDADVDTTPMEEPEVEMGGLTSIQCIRDAFEAVRSNMSMVTISEFSEVRSMLADLMSQTDRIANKVTGK